MQRRQWIAILALPVLVLTMLGIYQAAARWWGRRRAWYVGFWIYWPVWCLFFPWRLLGWQKLRQVVGPRKLNMWGWLLLLLPAMLTLLGRFFVKYDQKTERWETPALVAMAFVNGLLEEVLWRGVYLAFFPGNVLWGVAWPTLWFALWHLAPGSVSGSMPAGMLMAGAAGFGTCWSWLAFKTGTIRWSVLSHTLTGLVRVLGGA
jgi:membrane protease YdiL (CAAX protease family)